LLNWSGPHIYKNLFIYLQSTFYEIPNMRYFKAWDWHQYGIKSIGLMAMLLLPIMFGIMVTALTVELAQVGVLITGKPLKPQLERINPIKGFKRVFSLKSVVELIKSMLKTLIIGYVVFTTIRDYADMIIYSIKDPIVHALQLAGMLLITIAKKVAGMMVIIAFLDYFYQRWEFEKSLRMSKQEVKDEYKQSEGDPLIKGKQKQKMRQMSMGQVRQEVPEASAVVSNPTHYAVGIKYEDGMDAPKIVAKGRDELAIYIREVAREHDIPIFEDPPLARGLYNSCDLGDFIHPDFYVAIAKIVAALMKQRGGKMPAPSDGSPQSRGRMGQTIQDEDKDALADRMQKGNGPA
jgi:flagellar biosynthetic protein FlhB